jgi:hypothetical protein
MSAQIIDINSFSTADLLSIIGVSTSLVTSRGAGIASEPAEPIKVIFTESTPVAASRGKKGKKTAAAAATPAAAAPAAKPKAKRQSGSWCAWTTKCQVDYKTEIDEFKKTCENKCGAHFTWISANYGNTSTEYLAFKAEFDLAHPKGSEASEAGDSEASEAEAGEQVAVAAVAAPAAAKKRGPKNLVDRTPEQRAKHEAGVAERKAKKAANKVVDAMIANAPLQVAPVPLPLMVGGGSSAVPEPVTTAAAEDSEEEADVELKPFSMDGQNYIRLWSNSANDWATNDLWYTNKKGEKSAYWGELMEDGSVNSDAEEPTFN